MTNGRTSTGPILVAFLLWVIAFGLSVFLAANTEATGSGFTAGLNRIGTFFRWQFLAFALAILTWRTGRGRSDLSTVNRLMVRVPITIQCLLGLAAVVVVILGVAFR